MSVTIEIPELKNFQKGLKSLPERVSRRILKTALKNAGQILLERVKSVVPVQTGALQKTIRGKAKSISPVEQAYMVGTMGGISAYNATLIEYGHKWIIKHKGRVIRTGYKAPAPFMRPSFDATKDEVQASIVKDVGDAVGKEWKKITRG